MELHVYGTCLVASVFEFFSIEDHWRTHFSRRNSNILKRTSSSRQCWWTTLKRSVKVKLQLTPKFWCGCNHFWRQLTQWVPSLMKNWVTVRCKTYSESTKDCTNWWWKRFSIRNDDIHNTIVFPPLFFIAKIDLFLSCSMGVVWVSHQTADPWPTSTG